MSQASSKRVRINQDIIRKGPEDTAREHLQTQHPGSGENRQMLLHTSHELDFHCASKFHHNFSYPKDADPNFVCRDSYSS